MSNYETIQETAGLKRLNDSVSRLEKLLYLESVSSDGLKRAVNYIEGTRTAQGVRFYDAPPAEDINEIFTNRRGEQERNMNQMNNLMSNLKRIEGMGELPDNKLMDMYYVVTMPSHVSEWRRRSGGGQKSRKKCKARRRKHSIRKHSRRKHSRHSRHSRRKHKGTKRRRTRRR